MAPRFQVLERATVASVQDSTADEEQEDAQPDDEAADDQDQNPNVPGTRETFYTLVHDCFITFSGGGGELERREIAAWIKENAVKEKVRAKSHKSLDERVAHVLSSKKVSRDVCMD